MQRRPWIQGIEVNLLIQHSLVNFGHYEHAISLNFKSAINIFKKNHFSSNIFSGVNKSNLYSYSQISGNMEILHRLGLVIYQKINKREERMLNKILSARSLYVFQSFKFHNIRNLSYAHMTILDFMN